ncbi:MAG: sugar ABC transporter substrate-binding protein [Anaerolineae bacterium]|nr:sugar ABC transporter substrate-binding protein [Anaerolineae bacterium]
MAVSISRRAFLVRMGALGGAAVASGVLAACAGAPAGEAPAATQVPAEAAATTAPAAVGEVVTLQMWKGPHKAAGDETVQCAGPTLEKFMAEYPNIKVEFQEVPWSGYNEKFTSAFAAGQPPDVSYQTESFPTFVKAGNILPLDDLMAQSGFDKGYMLDLSWTCAEFEGKTYAMPWIEGGSCMFYNKDLFEQAGLDPETPPDTMDDFLVAAQKITELGDDIYGYSCGPRSYHEVGQWGIRWGGAWFNEDLTECIADSEESIAGFQFMADLLFKYEVSQPAAIAGQEPGTTGYFRDGFIGMITAQSPTANSIRAEKPDFPLGAAFVPKGPAPEPNGRAAYGGVGMLAIAQASRHVPESWTLLEWLVTPDALKSWIGCLGFSTAAKTVYVFEEDPVLAVAEEGRRFHFFWPYTEWVFKFWDVITTYTEAIQLGEMTAEAAMKECTQKVNDILAEYRAA